MGPTVLGMTMAVAGAVLALASARRLRRTAPDLGDFLGEFRAEPADDFQRELGDPFTARLTRMIGRALGSTVGRFLPREYLETIRHRLDQVGKAHVRPIDFLAGQVVLGVMAGGLALAYVLTSAPSPAIGAAMLVLLPVVGFTVPSARLTRQVAARNEAILDDLPDVLDLLAISVEAGLGFEAALDLVCQHFTSPLAEEFSQMLREMGLGRSRGEALQTLKRRADVHELSVFVLVLLQADALGIPVGRVLKTQAVEMRARRRQRAREKAAKLPVKILFPLVLFIFPPILAVVLGPAALSFSGLQ